ncbi:MAG: indole-3-glycerol phosphate synthase TrpC [Bryobacter sp.]|jgi:indole-3-glycerol phosphate synthase|nr:indole-3-glycerol phosphate synthase TrpC [Bryobacter sp. CoA8 C33]
MSVPGILARIVARKQEELESLRPQRSRLEHLAVSNKGRQRGFASALRVRSHISPAIIAEIKKASPSRGVLAENFSPVDIARGYERNGAAALSVLTDRDFFQGSLDHLTAARTSTGLPVLRKDFTLEDTHILEAAAHGADAILLIAAILTTAQLRDLREFASSLGLDTLVEVHDGPELESAIESGATIIGVNNRDLNTFEVSLETSLTLAPRIPESVLRVSESGIFTREHIATLRAAGYSAFLVGESLMRNPATLRELVQ